MRLRNKPWAKDYISQNPQLIIPVSEELKSSWSKIYANSHPLALEIGCGKGDFIISLANKNPNINYLGIEKFSSVLVTASKKVEASTATNIRLMVFDAKNLLEILKEKSLAVIYLNFSDPWSKKRHNKRRLTSPSFLKMYQILLKDDGYIIMKTDNTELFEYSLQTLKENNFIVKEYDNDYIFNNEIDSMSEYEQKFRQQGIKIKRLVAQKGE